MHGRLVYLSESTKTIFVVIKLQLLYLETGTTWVNHGVDDVLCRGHVGGVAPPAPLLVHFLVKFEKKKTSKLRKKTVGNTVVWRQTVLHKSGTVIVNNPQTRN
jgi:hypothetical protein